jgi:hypothetical protein
VILLGPRWRDRKERSSEVVDRVGFRFGLFGVVKEGAGREGGTF